MSDQRRTLASRRFDRGRVVGSARAFGSPPGLPQTLGATVCDMSSLTKRLWAWVVGPRAGRSFYPWDGPRTRRQRQRELLGSAKHRADEFPSGDVMRRLPPSGR
jgi:hypothetical protein